MTGKGDIQATLAPVYTEWVRATCEIAQAYAYQARLDDALTLLDSDAAWLVEPELSPRDRVRLQVQRASTLRYKGWLNNDHGCYAAALSILSETREVVGDLADPGLQADVVDLTGVLSYAKELGRSTLDDALEYFERGLALRRESGGPRTASARHGKPRETCTRHGAPGSSHGIRAGDRAGNAQNRGVRPGRAGLGPRAKGKDRDL